VYPAANPDGIAAAGLIDLKVRDEIDGDDSAEGLPPCDNSCPIITSLSNNSINLIPFDANFYAKATCTLKQWLRRFCFFNELRSSSTKSPGQEIRGPSIRD
jgi:hypothetical protein